MPEQLPVDVEHPASNPLTGPGACIASACIGKRWAILPQFLSDLFLCASAGRLARVKPLDYFESRLARAASADGRAAGEPQATYRVVNRVAIVPVRGVILKEVPEWFDEYGMEATSAVDVREAVEAAVADPEVDSIIIAINSPGGEVGGVDEAGEAILAARAVKPVHAYCEDLCASAGYWLASQASRISANQTASIGCIGVYTVIWDSSEYFQSVGLVARLVASGPYKGTGETGVPVTDTQLQPIQEEIIALANIFTDRVARGRNADPVAVANIATGRTWLAGPSVELGLIDAVETDRQALAAAVKAGAAFRAKGVQH